MQTTWGWRASCCPWACWKPARDWRRGPSLICLLVPGWEGMRSTLGCTIGHAQGLGCVQCHETHRVRCPGTARDGLGVCCVSGVGWPWGALLRAQNQGLGQMSKSRAPNAAHPKWGVGSRQWPEGHNTQVWGLAVPFCTSHVDAARGGHKCGWATSPHEIPLDLKIWLVSREKGTESGQEEVWCLSRLSRSSAYSGASRG